MKSLLRNRLIVNTLQSFFTSWALMKASRMEPGNIFTVIYFLLAFFFYSCVQKKLDRLCAGESGQDLSANPLSETVSLAVPVRVSSLKKRINRTSAVTAALFTLFYMAVDYPLYIETLTNPFFKLAIISFVLCGFWILFYHLLQLFFSMTCNKSRINAVFIDDCSSQQLCRISVKSPFKFFVSLYSTHSGLCSFLLCLLCWLPYFLYQYPGIMTPDSINQFEQVLGLIPYSNHHPWMHTLLIGLFYNIGYSLTGSMLVALSFYTFFQMCLLSYSICYFINTLKHFHVRSGICFLATLFYALIPYHAVFSVTIWKDIPFAAAVLLFGCAMLRLMKDHFPSHSSRICAMSTFVISGIMLCLFRSNGWYAFLLCIPFLLIHFRKKARAMIFLVLTIFVTTIIIKYPVMNLCHVTQPDLVESLSIPIQQVTAVICNDRPLSDEELNLIEQVVDLTYIKELYDRHYADNIKELVRAGNQDYLSGHRKEFLKLWIHLGLKYPGDYITAYIHQTYGYWYPDSFYPVAEAEGVSATALGVSHTPLIRGPLVIKAKEISIKLGGMVPLYGTLWSMGVACWILILCIGNTFVRNEKQKLILYLPSIALLLTVLIATPVATEFRYVYFMILSLPFYLISSLLQLPKEQT